MSVIELPFVGKARLEVGRGVAAVRFGKIHIVRTLIPRLVNKFSIVITTYGVVKCRTEKASEYVTVIGIPRVFYVSLETLRNDVGEILGKRDE